MSTLLENNFRDAVNVAAATRQVAYAAATATYAGVFANLATYIAALVTADNAYYDAVQTAATTAGISPGVVSLPGGFMPGKTATIVT